MATETDLAPKGTATAAIHGDACPVRGPWEFSTEGDIAPPLSVSTTFQCAENGQGHVYARTTCPTRSRCEALLAAVEGTPEKPAHAVLYSSGLAACHAILSRLMPRRVAITGGYHGTHLVLQQLRRLSTHFQELPLPTPEDAPKVLQAGDLVWLETPQNPSCHVADIAAYVAAAKSVGDVRVVVDGTFAPPPLQRPLLLGVDAVLHATTKYFAGHSDAMGGVICCSCPTLADELIADRVGWGSIPGSLEVWLLLRSIRTLHLRVERQAQTAAALAAWLEGACGAAVGSHPLAGLVHAVHHPSLPSSPSHEVAKRQMTGGFGGCFALELATEEAAKSLPGVLKLFQSATSLGGVESLVEWRRKYDAAVSPLLLRLSIGLEDAEHLKQDLQQGILAVSPS